MRNNYRTLLYFVIILLILGSLAILFLRQPITETLSTRAELSAYVVPSKSMNAANRESSELEILKNSRFISLKNNVINFDFENICGKAIAQSGTGKATSCTLGNNRPFTSAAVVAPLNPLIPGDAASSTPE